MTTITLNIGFKENKARDKAKNAGFKWNPTSKIWTKEFASVEEMDKWEKWASSNTILMVYKAEDSTLSNNERNANDYGQVGHWVNGNNGE